MKKSGLKIVLVALSAVIITSDVCAQKRTTKSRKTTGGTSSGYGSSSSSGYGAPSGTSSNSGSTGTSTGSGTSSSGYGSSGYGSTGSTTGASTGYGGASAPAASSNQPFKTTLPIKFIKGSGSGIGDSVAPSLRIDNAIDRNLVKDRTPLTYEHIREDDAVFKQRIWREIDTREKMNLPFRYAANEDNGNQRFISILFNSIQAGDVTAFNGDDDRFTTPMTKEEVSKIITGGLDTSTVLDMNGDPVSYEVRQRMIEPDSIYRFRLKEEWIFDKESSRMFVRILGIAPIMMQYTSTGIPIGDRILFWAYYPDLRPTLAKFEVFNGKNFSGRMSWEELFESRFFSSYITKSTYENPYDRSLREYIKDPLFRLLEGENIKEKIFNYEQDLWSY